MRCVRLAELTLPGMAWAVPVARQCVLLALSGRGHPQAASEVVGLLTSELVTNAVVHTASGSDGQFTVELHEDTEPGGPVSVTVVVLDQGSASVPAMRTDSADDGGRGLALVASLAAAWGHRAEGDGFAGAVWFEVAMSRDDPDAQLAGLPVCEMAGGGVQ